MKHFLLNVGAAIYFLLMLYMTWKALKFFWKRQPDFVDYRWSRKSKAQRSMERLAWTLGNTGCVFILLIIIGFWINIFSFDQSNKGATINSPIEDNLADKADLISFLNPDLPTENDEIVITNAIRGPVNPLAIEHLNQNAIELCILYIVAKKGAEFGNSRLQNWFERKSWYDQKTKNSIHATLKTLDPWDIKNIDILLKQREIVRNSKIKRESAAEITGKIYYGILSIDNYNKVKKLVKEWDLTKVSYEIDSLHAHYGYVFPDNNIQEYFSKQEWYAPNPAVTIEAVFNKFSPEEKAFLRILLDHKKSILDKHNQSPKYQIFNEAAIQSWSVLRIQEEINTVYARYGVDFSGSKMSTWAESLSDYKPVQGRTFEQAELLFRSEDREYIKKLAARRDFLNAKK